MKTPGLISGLFLIFYSVFRFIIEFIRVPDEQLGYLFLNEADDHIQLDLFDARIIFPE